MQNQQQQNVVLSSYIQKPRHHSIAHSFNKIQQQIGNVKQMMSKLEKTFCQNQKSIQAKLEQVSKTQTAILEFYNNQQQIHALNTGSSLVADFCLNEKSIQDIYSEQVRKSSQIQRYIKQIAQQTDLYLLQLQKYEGDEKEKQKKSRAVLPEPQALRSQVLQQINQCQKQFNKLMKQTQEQLEESLRRVEQTQKMKIKQLEQLVNVRINAMQCELETGQQK